MAELLPTTTEEQVASFQAELQAALNTGSAKDVEGAKCRLIWALVHSPIPGHVQRGLDMARAALDLDRRTTEQDRELKYFIAVAYYNQRCYLDARHALQSLLRDYPDFRQAESLLADVDEKVIKQGLVGLGIGAGVAAVVGVGLGLLLGGTSRRR